MSEQQSKKRTATIGRGVDCDVVVDDPSVSTRHCRLAATPRGLVLEDLGSTNGTYVNGERLVKPTPVEADDRITLGLTCAMPWPAWVASSASAAAPAQDKQTARVIRIGRAVDNDVVLDDPSVSAKHARIICRDGRLILEDLGSTNGTAVGRPENRITSAAIGADDTVYLGTLRVRGEQLFASASKQPENSHATILLGATTIVFGRDPSCDEVLDAPSISWRHASITDAGGVPLLKDLASTNGTYLNGQRVMVPVPVKPGDIIHLGTYVIRVGGNGRLEKRDHRGNVTIEARDLVVEVPGRRLLDNVSLTVFPTEFVGLMGPSGAGKTTLMNALNGYTRPTRGQVLLNGQDLYGCYSQFATYLGYVPQDDIIHRELTVGEALYFTARLRLPHDYQKKEIRKRVGAVLEQLDLQGTENVLIGSAEKKGISGGQRKRVNLAMELLTDPLVLFLDEPTSGLSSEDALLVMRLLRRLADSGKTILLTVHQPSLEAYRLLDNLTLVAKDKGSSDAGQLVYYGPAYPAAAQFFNPSDLPQAEPLPDDIFKGLSQRPAAEWAAAYRRSRFHQQYVAARAGHQSQEAPCDPQSKNVQLRDLMAQWWTLSARCLTIKRKDVWNTLILAAQAPIVAILVVLVFGDQTKQQVDVSNPLDWSKFTQSLGMTIFLTTLAALWFGCSNAAREIVGEWSIYHRERMVNLLIPSYIGSKLTVLGGLCIIQCLILLGITHWGCSLKAPWLPMFAVLLLVSFVGVAIGLTLSAVARTSEVAIGLLPIILLPMIILSGALRPVHKLEPVIRAMTYIVPSRWAFESALLLEAEKQPRSVVASSIGPSRADSASDAVPSDGRDKPVETDVAEDYFPHDDHRTGVTASMVVLVFLWAGAVLAVHQCLRCRDVHRTRTRWR